MTASLGKGIAIATVGAFFGWQAGLFGTTLDSLNPALSEKLDHAFLPDIPIWGYALIVLGVMIAVPALYRFSVGAAVLACGGWLAWQGLSSFV